MDVKAIIRKARQHAKTADEHALPDRFEEYLELLEMKNGATEEERRILEPRLKRCTGLLKELAERAALSYGLDPNQMIEFFSNPDNLEPGLAESAYRLVAEEKSEAPRPKRTKRNSKRLKS